MKTRTVEEIEKAFREMGLTKKTWGQAGPPETDLAAEQPPSPQIFIRIETTTKPLEENTNADLA
jgi:hypothetical protein